MQSISKSASDGLLFRYQVLGEIRNVVSNQCLDTMGRKENENVGIYTCHGQGGNQVNIIRFDLFIYLLGFLLHNGQGNSN